MSGPASGVTELAVPRHISLALSRVTIPSRYAEATLRVNLDLSALCTSGRRRRLYRAWLLLCSRHDVGNRGRGFVPTQPIICFAIDDPASVRSEWGYLPAPVVARLNNSSSFI